MCRQRTATHCNTLQHTATPCLHESHEMLISGAGESCVDNALQHTATHCNTLQHTATRTATHCNTLPVYVARYAYQRHRLVVCRQRNAMHCNTLQHAATHCLHKSHETLISGACWLCVEMILHSTTCCSTLQHTATRCNALSAHVARDAHQRRRSVVCRKDTSIHCNTLQHTATHCNTLQRTVTRCNTLQHTATHCNTL